MKATPADLDRYLESLPQRMSHVVRHWADATPEAVALVEGQREMHYRQLQEALRSAAQWLAGRGVRAGDRVMVVGENSIALAVLVLAIGEMDAWPLVVNARISTREVLAIREHSGARLVVLCAGAAAAIGQPHAQALLATACVVPGIGEVAVSPVDEQAVAEPVHADGKRQVGALIYTSGTTGTPKGVMLSHHSVMFTAAVGGWLRGMQQGDRQYGVLPMSHIVGFSSVLLCPLMFGATLELVARFDASAALQALASGRVTRFQGVPTMYQRLLEASQGGAIACPGLRGIYVAGAPLDAALKNSVEAAMGLVLHNGYGITECAPTVSMTRAQHPPQDTAVGAPIPGVGVRLMSREGRDVTGRDVGELHVRGPNVMLGYYRAPEQTRAAISEDGWFNTGDLARFDGANLHIVGRTKELIIRSGFNVYPPEVEAVLAAHPAVVSCAVVGRPVQGNEEVVAFVQLRQAMPVTAQELIEFSSAHLAPYKRPAEVVIRQDLPTTSAGKILKHLLAREAAGGPQ